MNNCVNISFAKINLALFITMVCVYYFFLNEDNEKIYAKYVADINFNSQLTDDLTKSILRLKRSLNVEIYNPNIQIPRINSELEIFELALDKKTSPYMSLEFESQIKSTKKDIAEILKDTQPGMFAPDVNGIIDATKIQVHLNQVINRLEEVIFLNKEKIEKDAEKSFSKEKYLLSLRKKTAAYGMYISLALLFSIIFHCLANRYQKKYHARISN